MHVRRITLRVISYALVTVSAAIGKMHVRRIILWVIIALLILEVLNLLLFAPVLHT